MNTLYQYDLLVSKENTGCSAWKPRNRKELWRRPATAAAHLGLICMRSSARGSKRGQSLSSKMSRIFHRRPTADQTHVLFWTCADLSICRLSAFASNKIFIIQLIKDHKDVQDIFSSFYKANAKNRQRGKSKNVPGENQTLLSPQRQWEQVSLKRNTTKFLYNVSYWLTLRPTGLNLCIVQEYHEKWNCSLVVLL